MKRVWFVLSAFLVFLFVASKGYTIEFPTEFEISFQNYEWFNPNVRAVDPASGYAYEYWDGSNWVGATDPDGTEDNWGIANIEKVKTMPTRATVWTEGDNGEYVYGIFYNLDLAYWYNDGSYGMTATPSGAYLDFYLWHDTDPGFESFDTTGVVNASRRNPPRTFTGITEGELLARFQFTYGVEADTNIVAAGSTESGTAPASGDGQAFLKVVEGVGSMWQIFDQDRDALVHVLDYAATDYVYDWIDPEADLWIKFSYSVSNPLFTGSFNLESHDPGYGATPEPATIMLMGSGLLVMGVLCRKKFSSKG